jgi:hypothetical protein
MPSRRVTLIRYPFLGLCGLTLVAIAIERDLLAKKKNGRIRPSDNAKRPYRNYPIIIARAGVARAGRQCASPTSSPSKLFSFRVR